MVSEDDSIKVFEYLKKQGQTNTFRLARELGIDRHIILNIIKKLEEKHAVEVRSGVVRFLKFPERERKSVKKIIEVKQALSEPKKIVKYKAKRSYKKKAIGERKLSILQNLQTENKRLGERLTELESNIKQQSSINNKLRSQSEHIENLEKTIKVLQQKANAPPKIIRKTIVKNIIKKIPVKDVKKFKIPKFNLNWIKNIQQLKKPEFIGQKISIEMPKINFLKLNKNIQNLHVPGILKNF